MKQGRDGRDGLVVLITAGGTREPIDDVRHISNVASGRLPAAMAERWLSLGATVHYVHGPGARRPGVLEVALPLVGEATQRDTARRDTAPLDAAPLDAAPLDAALRNLCQQARQRQIRCARGILRFHPVHTASEAAETLRQLAADVQPDIAACAMAVADFSPVATVGKLRSRQPGQPATALTLQLLPTAKVIDVVMQQSPTTALLGFKLLSNADETSHRQAAQELAARSGARWVFGNDMVDYRRGIRRGVLRAADGSPLVRLGDDRGLADLERAVVDLADALVDAVMARL